MFSSLLYIPDFLNYRKRNVHFLYSFRAWLRGYVTYQIRYFFACMDYSTPCISSPFFKNHTLTCQYMVHQNKNFKPGIINRLSQGWSMKAPRCESLDFSDHPFIRWLNRSMILHTFKILSHLTKLSYFIKILMCGTIQYNLTLFTI